MTDNRYGDAPLGRSVEEIEQESGNLDNSPVQGEEVRSNEPGLVPAVANGNTSGVPALINPDGLTEHGSGPEDGTARSGRGNGEGTT